MNYECIKQNTFLLRRKIMIGALAAFLLVPLQGYSAPYPTLDDHPVKVKLGEVTKTSNLLDTFTLKLASSTLSVTYTGSTTIFLGTGEQVTTQAIVKGSKVYVFGVQGDDEESFIAEKIVIKNPSKLSRNNLEQYKSEKLNELSTAVSLWTTLWKGVTFTTAYSAERIQYGIGYLESSSTGAFGNMSLTPKNTSIEIKPLPSTTSTSSTSTPFKSKKNELSVRQRLII